MGTDWYRPRGYPHFDDPIDLDRAERLVANPSTVARHAFWPFLRYERVSYTFDYAFRSRTVKKRREIMYASHEDAAILAFYSAKLEALYEASIEGTSVSDAVLAYRRKRDPSTGSGMSNIQHARDAFAEIARRGDCVALCLDISDFFGSIDHDRLRQRWAALLGTTVLPGDHFNVFKNVTRHASVDRGWAHSQFNVPRKARGLRNRRICSPREFRRIVRPLIRRNAAGKGIPQGSPISALLSNLFLLEFDQQMRGLAETLGALYLRYSDDILLICDNQDATLLECEATRLMVADKLTINADKTQRRSFRRNPAGAVEIIGAKPLQYLGFCLSLIHI